MPNLIIIWKPASSQGPLEGGGGKRRRREGGKKKVDSTTKEVEDWNSQPNRIVA